MPAETECVRCQRCLAQNPLDGEFCSLCGTPLMLVVASNAHRYEDQATMELHGEHLLERISALENALARVAVIAEQALTLALQQSAVASADILSVTKLAASLEQESENTHSGVGRRQNDLPRESRKAKTVDRNHRSTKSPGKRVVTAKAKARRP